MPITHQIVTTCSQPHSLHFSLTISKKPPNFRTIHFNCPADKPFKHKSLTPILKFVTNDSSSRWHTCLSTNGVDLKTRSLGIRSSLITTANSSGASSTASTESPYSILSKNCCIRLITYLICSEEVNLISPS